MDLLLVLAAFYLAAGVLSLPYTSVARDPHAPSRVTNLAAAFAAWPYYCIMGRHHG